MNRGRVNVVGIGVYHERTDAPRPASVMAEHGPEALGDLVKPDAPSPKTPIAFAVRVH